LWILQKYFARSKLAPEFNKFKSTYILQNISGGVLGGVSMAEQNLWLPGKNKSARIDDLLKGFAEELFTFGSPLPENKEYTSLTKKEMKERLEQYFNLLRVSAEIPGQKPPKRLETTIDLSSSLERCHIVSRDSNGETMIDLAYTPHIKDPYGKSFKFRTGNESMLTAEVLHSLTHLLHIGDFEYTETKDYTLKFLLPNLPEKELKSYDKRFSILWNSFLIVHDAYSQPTVWEDSFKEDILTIALK
jgi:hypothetical protein